MKIEWDELQMLSGFIRDNPEIWIEYIEKQGFTSDVADAILTKLLYMTQEEERAYVERFGTRKPSLATSNMQVSKGDLVFDIPLEYNQLDGWYVCRVPGKLAFVLLASSVESAKERLESRGWKILSS